MRRMSDSLRAHIERYYATVPLLFADAEEFGALRLFVRKEPGTPYYGGPSHAQPTAEGSGSVTASDIVRVRARQRELGVPEAFEWLAEAARICVPRIEAVDLPVAEQLSGHAMEQRHRDRTLREKSRSFGEPPPALAGQRLMATPSKSGPEGFHRFRKWDHSPRT
jgi:hypothetical protein